MAFGIKRNPNSLAMAGRKMTNGGRTRSVARGRGRKMAHGGGARRTHGHPYQPPTQAHWSTHPGGTMQSGLGYTHTDTGGPSHSHPFLPETQAHMGSKAKGRGPMGYSHTHTQREQGGALPPQPPDFDCRHHWEDCGIGMYCHPRTGQCVPETQGNQTRQRGGKSGRKMAHGGTFHCGHPGQPACPPDYNSKMGKGRKSSTKRTQRTSTLNDIPAAHRKNNDMPSYKKGGSVRSKSKKRKK